LVSEIQPYAQIGLVLQWHGSFSSVDECTNRFYNQWSRAWWSNRASRPIDWEPGEVRRNAPPSPSSTLMMNVDRDVAASCHGGTSRSPKPVTSGPITR